MELLEEIKADLVVVTLAVLLLAAVAVAAVGIGALVYLVRRKR